IRRSAGRWNPSWWRFNGPGPDSGSTCPIEGRSSYLRYPRRVLQWQNRKGRRVIVKLIKWGTILGFVALLAVSLYCIYVYREIRDFAVRDEARPADAIVVLGAAQYNGRPSPVLKARLDHAYELFKKGYAPAIITTGSYGPDPNFSE